MAKKAVTIKEVAEAAGVSRATVSAVLHGREWVSAETRDKVEQFLQQKQYQKHLLMNSLSRHFSKVIGVVIGNIRNPFNTEFISGLQEHLGKEGYFVLHHHTDESYESEVRALESLASYELGGYVVAPAQEGRPHDHIKKLIDEGKVLVSIGAIPDLETNAVDFDDDTANRNATDYLIQRGHTRIVCLAGAETSSFARHRIKGYVEGLMSHHLPIDESLIVRVGDSLTEGYRATIRILREYRPRPTAFLCFNDLIAMSVYQAAHELGIGIPTDLSVIGFDDCQLAAILGPPLTTVATYPVELARHAAEIIISIQQGNVAPGFIQRRTHPRLIERLSVSFPAPSARG